MEKTNLYDELVDVEKTLQTMLSQIGEMKDVVDTVLEKNLNLELENQHLRDRLEKLEREDLPEDSKQELSKSRLNLEKLYEQGFHVCKDFYGSRRENHEECVFVHI